MINELTKETLQRIKNNAPNNRILTVGDIILDRYIFGEVNRISPEAPVPIVEFTKETYVPGGAANVAANIKGLGTSSYLIGFIGNNKTDQESNELLSSSLYERNIVNYLIKSAQKRTIQKTRIIGGHQQIVRIDKEDKSYYSEEDYKYLRDQLLEGDFYRGFNAVILSDYNKKTITQKTLHDLSSKCEAYNVYLAIGAKPASGLYIKRPNLLSLNKKEAFELTGEKNIITAIDIIKERINPYVLIITLGAEGMVLYDKSLNRITNIPTFAQKVFDVSGAGDTVLAAFVVAQACGVDSLQSALFATKAAGIVVGRVGTAAIDKEVFDEH